MLVVKSGFINAGVQDHLQEINPDLWATAMLQESEEAPPFYVDTFANEATAVLCNDLHMRRDDISFFNCKSVYIHLVNAMS